MGEDSLFRLWGGVAGEVRAAGKQSRADGSWDDQTLIVLLATIGPHGGLRCHTMGLL